ncbi:MAG: endonuclease/exonuclease/phosphatase family protein [Actinomycetota bacterium]
MRPRRFVPLLLALALAAGFAGARTATADAVIGQPLCGTEGTAPAPATSGALHVATFNVLHGLSEDPPDYPAHSTLDERTEMAAEQLAASGVDLVGMQEVSFTAANDQTRHTPGLVVQRIAAQMAQTSGHSWHWCWYLANPHVPGEDTAAGGGGPLSDQLAALGSSRYASFKEGVAVLSRYPILLAEGRRLPSRLPAEAALCPPESFTQFPPECAATVVIESRAALWARVAAPGGATDIVTTHLAHGLTDASDASAFTQVAAALAFAEQKSADGAAARRFFTCDCNSRRDDDVPVVPSIEAAGWTDMFPETCESAGDAGCTAGPDKIVTDTPMRDFMDARIDYVFEKSCPAEDAGLLANQARARDDGSYLWPSDHIGIIATC